MMDEKSTDDRLRNRRQGRNSETELMMDFHKNPGGRFLESPDDAHPARECLQMEKSNFHPLTVDHQLGCPGNWDAGAQRRHFHHTVIRISFEKIDVAIVRE